MQTHSGITADNFKEKLAPQKPEIKETPKPKEAEKPSWLDMPYIKNIREKVAAHIEAVRSGKAAPQKAAVIENNSKPLESIVKPKAQETAESENQKLNLIESNYFAWRTKRNREKLLGWF